MTIDVCVTNHNTSDKLERLIETLRTTSEHYGKDPPWNLWIADNGSTDGSLDMMQKYCINTPEWNGKHLHRAVMLCNKNVGYAIACNQLADIGLAPVIGLLNADVWLTTQDLEAIEKVFAEHDDVDILGPKQRNEQGHLTHGGIFGTLDKPAHRGWQYPDPDDLHYRDNLRAVTVAGSAYFIRRSVWEELTQCPTYRGSCHDIFEQEPQGAFLPTAHYFEETFCSYHAQAHGYGVWYWGEISIGHTWHASHEVGSFADKMFHNSQALFRRACDQHQIIHD